MESLLRHPKIIAIGEMGLDFSFHHLKQNPKHLQKEVLERQLVLAALVAKPVIFHQRECDNEVLVAAKKHLPPIHQDTHPLLQAILEPDDGVDTVLSELLLRNNIRHYP